MGLQSILSFREYTLLLRPEKNHLFQYNLFNKVELQERVRNKLGLCTKLLLKLVAPNSIQPEISVMHLHVAMKEVVLA